MNFDDRLKNEALVFGVETR